MASSPSKILVVDDDAAIRKLIHRFLSLHSYEVESAANGKAALSAFEKFQPDLVILDLNLPDISGFELCQKLRSQTDVLVLMLTCLNNTQHILQGFEKGADDYLTKPFDLHILLARIKAVLRRKRIAIKPRNNAQFVFDRVSIDPQACEVRIDDYPVTLTALEYNLLYFFATHPHQVWKRHEIVEEVWQEEYIKQDRKVDVHVGQLRRKIKDCNNQLIQTVRGQGYRFVPPEMQLQKSA